MRLNYYRGGIQFHGSAVYEEERRRAEQEAAEALPAFEDEGVL